MYKTRIKLIHFVAVRVTLLIVVSTSFLGYPCHCYASDGSRLTEENIQEIIKEAEANYLIREKEKAVSGHKEELAIAEAEQINWEKEKANIIAKLRASGIYDNQEVWLKYPKFDMPGLSKIKIIHIELTREVVDYKYSNTKGVYKKIFLNIVSNSRPDKLEFNCDNLNEELLNVFYFKYPATKWSKRVLKAIKEGNVLIGMTKDQVRASIGLPSDINRSGGTWGLHEQWVYGSSLYIYFENGRVSSWQD